MNNVLEELIKNLTSQELRDFKYFISRRNNHIHERRDLQTLEQLRQFHKQDHHTLSNAEHQVKKRLKKQLEQFVQLENLRFDVTSVSLNYIEVATYLFRKKIPGHAWQYLLKAELQSLENEDYILLDFIYYIQIAYASNIYGRVLPSYTFKKLIEKRNANLVLSMLDSNANLAYAEIRYQIKELNSNSKNDIQVIIDKTLKQYHLSDKVYTYPRIYGKIVNIVCSGLAEIEEFQKMADYAVSAFQIIKKHKMLETIHPDYLMELLLSLCQSHLWTKNYSRCHWFLSIYKLRTEIFRHRYDKYSYHKFVQGLMEVKLNFCKGDLDEAENIIFLLLHNHEKDNELIHDFHLVYMQLMAIYYSQGSIEPCIRLYNSLMREKTEGKIEELDQKIIIEIYSVIFYYELKDLDYAYELLKKIKRSYRSLLKTEDNKRYHFFIKILENLIKDPTCSAKDWFKEECLEFVALKKYILDNTEYISLNAWLLSKCTKTDYYNLFLKQCR